MLEPGDVITTGTPPGVGMGMKPPRYLKAGDVVSLGIGASASSARPSSATTTRPASTRASPRTPRLEVKQDPASPESS